MGEIMILNASPRAPKSNSKKYSEIFMKKCPSNAEYFNITKTNHTQLCEKISGYSDLVFVFPLYADGLPVTLLNFLKALENNLPENKPVVSVLINCGFLEYHQNDLAVEMVKIFCRKNGFKFGSVLKIGGGEAILTTPFKIFAVNKISRFAKSVSKGKQAVFCVTMPISKNFFIKASTKYWINYGKKNNVSQEEMNRMEIE